MTVATDALDFGAIDRDLEQSGPGPAIDGLVARLEADGEARALLDALLLKARHDLGLPLIGVGGLDAIAEPARTEYEDRYVAAIRHVGERALKAGDIVVAWPYFRVLGEKGPVARAILDYTPSGEPGDEGLGQVIDIAFNQGVEPRRGYELILEHYGACSAITAFEHLPPSEAIRNASADRLVRHLHESLILNLRAEISRRGQPLPPEGTSVAELSRGREWLYADDAYHLDLSHLNAVVRLSTILTDPAPLALAIELTEYGARLSDRHKYAGDPPFEDVYADHAVYLKALRGEDADSAVAHFRDKLPRHEPGEEAFADPNPAQVLVKLLVRLGRLDEAIDVSAARLATIPESLLACPGLAELCQRAGRPDRLAEASRTRGDLVQYAAARLEALAKT